MEGIVFFRQKKSGPRIYLQIVENRREGKKTQQQVIATLGRMDQLKESGGFESLLRSAAKFSQALMVICAHNKAEAPEAASWRIGPGMIFERLWRDSGCREVIEKLLKDRHFEFSVERAIFLTVLHRLCDPGSDRQADRWRQEYRIEGVSRLELHHLYRAMAWLGEQLPMGEPCEKSRFSARCTKDRIEEELFARRRDLFSQLDVVFFDTTSIYFEGHGGQTVGAYGNSKDHRSDCKQMVVGAVLDQDGNPVCCEMWPGNAADVKSLIPVVDRLRKRFGIGQVCIVADRGMISRETLRELESAERGWKYILGARMRNQKEVREEVLSVAGRYRVVHPKSSLKKDPSPLKVKDVVIEGRQYVVCVNEDQAQKDAADREAILEALREQLKRGDKSLVGNKGYRKYLKTTGKGFEIDEQKVLEEARYDGKWVLRTNTDLSTDQVALKYKQLWMVESLFRTVKSILETRPIYHKRNETILGHVFCSFLSFVLMKELQNRVEQKGYQLEWADVIRDLSRLQEVEIEQDGKRFLLRSEATGTCGKVFQSVGVALPPTVRQVC
jgi:transposase